MSGVSDGPSIAADPLVYPVARDFIRYRSPINIVGLMAWPSAPEAANGEALDSSYNGDTLGYEAGQTMRARYLPDPTISSDQGASS